MTQIMRQSHSQIQELSDRLAFTSGTIISYGSIVSDMS